ncbi:MAG TPA: bestrophin family ion channel [Chitinophagaceae bacterium]|nr:bestrophin family ion channel [Chitinophagaceae bacterium]
MLLKENIPFRYIYGKIKTEVLFITLYAVTIVVLYNNFHFTRISIPLAVPAILGTVISLLLGFRSNQAYDRWWEARHIWGGIVNDSRTLARQVLCFTEVEYTGDAIQHMRERFIKRQMAWCNSLGKHLRRLNTREGLDKYISRREQEFVANYSNVPVALLELHARDLNMALEMGWLNQYQQVELDRTLSRLCDAMGKCERIKNTVFPVTYSQYIHFSLLLFIGMLPFGVIEYFGIMEIPVVVAIASCFLLIEKMAIHLQDPFENKPTDTPVTTIARSIEKDLRQMLRDQELPEETEQQGLHFYVL